MICFSCAQQREANALTDETADSKLTRLIRGQIARGTYRTDLPDAAGAGQTGKLPLSFQPFCGGGN